MALAKRSGLTALHNSWLPASVWRYCALTATHNRRNNQAIKLLDRHVVTNNQITAPVDVGAYGVLQVQIRVHEAGSGGTVYLMHASVNEPLAFAQLGNSVNLNSANENGDFQTHTNFLRYVRCKAASVTGANIASADIIAKEK